MEEQKTQKTPAPQNTFLECERDIVFILMMLTVLMHHMPIIPIFRSILKTWGQIMPVCWHST